MCCSGFIAALQRIWNVWKNGGEVVETVKQTRITKTSKTLNMMLWHANPYRSIREQGANNLIIVEPDWGFGLYCR